MKTDNQTAATKKQYQAPQLSELGGLADATLAANTAGSDGNTQSAN